VMGSASVLATKLFVSARRQRLVARPRVAQRLSTTLDPGHRLTLVSAPAGFGKTTFLTDWLTDLDQQHRHTARSPLTNREEDHLRATTKPGPSDRPTIPPPSHNRSSST
jgi:ATP/maltotriose-dependent transcriptional regulator MalT